MKKKDKAKEPELAQQVTLTMTADGKIHITSDPKQNGWAILGFLEIAVASLKK